MDIIDKTEVVNKSVIQAPYYILIILIILIITIAICIIQWKKRK
jgi:hypothetical protein